MRTGKDRRAPALASKLLAVLGPVWQRASAIFDKALELPEAERDAWIADACGQDEELLGEVRSLLAAHGRAAGLLDRSTDEIDPEALAEPGGSDSSRSKIGPYIVRNEIGRGGMGVVYRAVDPRLHRDVALKLLPPSLTSNDKARQRLLAEARAASALDHPNICTIYDIGKADDDSLYFAMAYYEGQTLAARIEEGALPTEDALEVTAGILRGLDHAHSNGVIHRDVKPSNVLLTKRGEVKILDFGLAKRGVEERTDPDAQLGTLAYLSPEQVLGTAVDERTDLWSLGVTLHQMLAATPPFAEPQEAALLYAIAHEEPAPLPESVPSRIRRIVAKLLSKDPGARYRSAKELLQELDEEGAPTASVPSMLAPAPSKKPSPVLVAVVAGGLLFALLYLVAARLSQDRALDLGEPEPFTSLPGREERPSFSPDGDTVAFSWNGPELSNYDIYVQRIGSSSPRRLTEDPAWDSSPVWSPDGGSIAFLRALSDSESELWIRDLDRDSARRVATLFSGSRFGLSWSPDGAEIAAVDRVGPGRDPVIVLIDPESGAKRVLARSPAGSVQARSPLHSPDATMIAFEVVRGTWLGQTYVVPAAGGDLRRIEAGQGFPDGLTWFARSKALLCARSSPAARRSLWYASADGERGREFSELDDASEPVISPDGSRLAYSHRVSKYDIVRVDLPESEAPARPFISSTRFDGNPQYSPDGSRILFSSSRSGAVEIWTCDADGSNAEQLTFLGVAGSPKWSPDGSRVAFDSTVDGDSNIYVVDSTGGDPVRVTEDPAADYVPTWSADGRWIYFASDRAGSPQVWKIAVDGAAKPALITAGGGIYGIESADGASLYYAKSRSLDTSIWRFSPETGEDTPVVEEMSSGWSNWELGPGGIYYVNEMEAIDGVRAWGIYIRRFGSDASELLARLPHPPTSGAPGFSVSPDGRQALAGQITIESDLMIVGGDFR